MDRERRDFDAGAATWDDNPARVKLAKDIVRAISQEVALAGDMDVLEFGCGTGLITLGIAPSVSSVTGVDSSRGMLEVLEGKMSAQGIRNVKVLPLDIEKGEAIPGSYHLVVSSMTLHHIRDISGLIRTLSQVTAPGGHLCIADLDPDDGRFHENSGGVFHNGIDRSVLRSTMREAGFEEVRDRTAAGVAKPVKDQGMALFTIFLMTGRKRSSAGV